MPPGSNDYQQQAEALVARWLDEEVDDLGTKANRAFIGPDAKPSLIATITNTLRAAAEQAASRERERCVKMLVREFPDTTMIADVVNAIRHRRDPERHE